MHAVFFLFLEAKEAVEVIESSEVIMSVEVNEDSGVFLEPLRGLKSII